VSFSTAFCTPGRWWEGLLFHGLDDLGDVVDKVTEEPVSEFKADQYNLVKPFVILTVFSPACRGHAIGIGLTGLP